MEKNKNDTIMKNYESSNILQQYYKLFSKDNNKNNKDGDVSSIQLSESNNDKELRFLFNRRKKAPPKVNIRRSHQLDYKKLIKFRLKDENKKNPHYRYSMFNPKNTVIISPLNRIINHQGNNFSNILSNNGDFANNEDNKFFETFNNNKNNIYFNNATLIDNRNK